MKLLALAVFAALFAIATCQVYHPFDSDPFSSDPDKPKVLLCSARWRPLKDLVG